MKNAYHLITHYLDYNYQDCTNADFRLFFTWLDDAIEIQKQRIEQLEKQK